MFFSKKSQQPEKKAETPLKMEPQTVVGGKKPKKKYGRYIFATFLLVVLIAAGVVYEFAQKPAQGVVQPTKNINEIAQKAAEEVPEAFVGKYVSLMYKHGYEVRSHDVATDNQAVILEQAFLVQSSVASQKIALTVRILPSRNLEDDPDYKFRETDTKVYTKESFSAGDVSGSAFVPAGEGQFEKSFFIQHGNLLAIIDVNAPVSMNNTIEDEADAVAKSLTWLPADAK